MQPREPRWADTARQWLDAADSILVSAGAGLSVAAGVDYGDEADFAERFPDMVALGYRARYQLVGDWRLPPDVLWGYWARHVSQVRFGERHDEVYQRLRALVGARDSFVLTSNVDALFVRNGFDPSRIWTPQGDYALMQCVQPCNWVVWPSEPAVRALSAATDPTTGRVTDRHTIPSCPTCGGRVFFNVRVGTWFVEAFEAQHDKFIEWAHKALEGRLVILEVGAGLSTPGVVRYVGEDIALGHSHARLIRVNPAHSEVPTELAERSLAVPATALEALELLAVPLPGRG